MIGVGVEALFSRDMVWISVEGVSEKSLPKWDLKNIGEV